MANNYLDDVKKKRGKEAADALRADCRIQWDKGNRGARGEWR